MNAITLPSLRKALACLVLLLPSFGLISCASTPASRIESHPALYNKLSDQDKALVARGGIREGLHKDGVFLAWGSPASVRSGRRSGKSFDRWRYTRLEPVFIDSFAYHGGFGHYHPRGRRHYYHGIAYAPSVYYVPYVAAVVSFENDKVVSWEQER